MTCDTSSPIEHIVTIIILPVIYNVTLEIASIAIVMRTIIDISKVMYQVESNTNVIFNDTCIEPTM